MLLQRRLSTPAMRSLLQRPIEPAVLTVAQREGLAARLRAVPTLEQRRVDAWALERAGATSSGFAWSARSARRVLGRLALARGGTPELALEDVLSAQLGRVARGDVRPGSLAHWLGGLSSMALAQVRGEALNWMFETLEVGAAFELPFEVAATDTFYDVPGARTTVRGRRDLVLPLDQGRVVIRTRPGTPGRSAGAGLRLDLVAATLADADGAAPSLLLGVWPEAGLVLGVEGTLENLRAGGRDIVRLALVQRRARLVLAA